MPLISLVIAGCGSGGSGDGGSTTTTSSTSSLSAKAQVGKSIFFDTALSASGQQACSTCHDPSNGYSPSDGLPVQMGGPNMNLPGLRATPSLTYASYTPAFFFASDGTPTGGFFRDGRAASLAAQAQMPFTTSFEMANADAAEVVQRFLQRPYLADFKAVFGNDVSNPDQVLASMGAALAAYETEDSSFHPFSSKFDAFLNGQTTLTSAETKGLGLFNDPTKGNCTACHISVSVGGNPPLFTDFTYDNVGLPRNWKIAANQENNGLDYVPQNGAAAGGTYSYYDLGLCGPLNDQYSARHSLCGLFKVPTLRNVALRQHLFHNGVFDNLNDAVTWYVTRDTNPTRWYTTADGAADVLYNDLPLTYDANVNVLEVPYVPSLAPTLNDVEINDVVVFLCTLIDGFDPASPSSYKQPAQCVNAKANAAAAGQ